MVRSSSIILTVSGIVALAAAECNHIWNSDHNGHIDNMMDNDFIQGSVENMEKYHNPTEYEYFQDTP
ncbi:hypothetical protein AYI69_g3742, partial [Smittium culicis]